jgi:hypothetical protein
VELETYRTRIQSAVSWVSTPCSSVDGYQSSDETAASVFRVWLPTTILKGNKRRINGAGPLGSPRLQ